MLFAKKIGLNSDLEINLDVKFNHQIKIVLYCTVLTCADKKNHLTLSKEIVQESNFSDTAYNSAYVSDVQSLIAKSTLQQLFS